MDRLRGGHRGPALSTARLTLLLTSPRVAPGLLSREAWRVLDGADTVLARAGDDPLPAALADDGTGVEVAAESAPARLAQALLERAAREHVVWLGSPDGDPGLADAVAAEAAGRAQAPEIEVLVGSWDTPGARLLDAVAVMDRLRSPGGCPWDREQTHQSLVPYLLEEAYEAVEAVESGDTAHLAEELGDVLLQVLFHARVAAEREDGFDIDDVASGLVDKLVHRHPHVFADVDAEDAAAVEATWERLKADEKPHREHPLEGIPAGMPELARAAKVASRLDRAGRGAWLLEQVAEEQAAGGERSHGAVLLAAVLQARADGVDAAAALRSLLRRLEAEVARSS